METHQRPLFQHLILIVSCWFRMKFRLNGQRGVSADTALRLSRYLGTTAEFWLNLQKTFELRTAEIKTGEQIAKRIKPRQAA